MATNGNSIATMGMGGPAKPLLPLEVSAVNSEMSAAIGKASPQVSYAMQPAQTVALVKATTGAGQVDSYEAAKTAALKSRNALETEQFNKERAASMAAYTPRRTVIGNSSRPKHQALSNPLHEYATYTYGLTLFMLTTEEFEELQKTNESELVAWNPKHALISSAGRFNKEQHGITPGRAPEFTDDFYFDNFKMTTVIGFNSRTRGTNVVDMTFTIMEPYGLTLLDRLIEAANSDTLSSQNYLMQPYLLELDFFGSTDLGDISKPIQHLRKRFPIRLNEFKIKAGTKGSEYAIRATPYNHSALTEIAAATPINLEVAASTVGNFFNATTNHAIMPALATQNAKRKEFDEKTQAVKTAVSDKSNLRVLESRQQDVTAVAYDAKNRFNVISYTDAFNDWSIMLAETDGGGVGKMAEFPDEIAFQFSGFEKVESGILESKLTLSELPDKSKAMYPVNSKAAARTQTPNGLTVNSANARVFNINAGTSIVDVINLVMSKSEYIRKQIVDVNGNPNFKDDTIVKFYKIIPQIVGLKYDKLRKRYATKTIYHIVYYEYFNAKHPNLPYVSPTSAVKEYNYIYTGKNLDILDFAIDFDVAYYTTVVALPGNVNAGNANAPLTEGNSNMDPTRTNSNSRSLNQPALHPVSMDAQSGASGVQTGEEHLVANALASIYSGSKGDMIQVKLKIVGDPHFIKQDDVYTSPSQQNSRTELVAADGTIMMDYSDIFCLISFKTPSDIDDNTGLMLRAGNSKYAESKFSGFYKIVTVANEFSKGQFIQTLDCVRMIDMPVQDSATERNAADSGNNDPAAAGVRQAAVPTDPTGGKYTPTAEIPRAFKAAALADAAAIEAANTAAGGSAGLAASIKIDRANEQEAIDLARADSILIKKSLLNK